MDRRADRPAPAAARPGDQGSSSAGLRGAAEAIERWWGRWVVSRGVRGAAGAVVRPLGPGSARARGRAADRPGTRASSGQRAGGRRLPGGNFGPAGRRPTAARRGRATAWRGDGRLPAAARPGDQGSVSAELRGSLEAARRRGRPAAGSGRAGRRPGASRRGRADTGSASIEFLGFLPILILVALAAAQLGIAAYTAQQAGTAARAAARTASLDEPRTSPQAAGKAAMSGWLADGAGISSGGCGGGEARATATVEIPSVIPGFDFGSAEKSATMPCDDGEGDGGNGGNGGLAPAAMGGDR